MMASLGWGLLASCTLVKLMNDIYGDFGAFLGSCVFLKEKFGMLWTKISKKGE